jgi:hypothetical protein
MGALGHPAFPAPSHITSRDNVDASLGRTERRGKAKVCPTSLRGVKRRSNPVLLCALKWIASRSLSSGAHSRDPLARNDGVQRPHPEERPFGASRRMDACTFAAILRDARCALLRMRIPLLVLACHQRHQCEGAVGSSRLSAAMLAATSVSAGWIDGAATTTLEATSSVLKRCAARVTTIMTAQTP